MSNDYIRLGTLLFSVLNPFLMSIYLLELIRELELRTFASVLVRGALISLVVFVAFAVGGEAIFSKLLHVHFGSFQVFGGLIFVVIGLRFVFQGAESVEVLRGSPEHMVGSIAMPFMIGPGTVSASVIIGSSAPALEAAIVITGSVAVTIGTVLLLKLLHDHLQRRNARLIRRYVEIVGRLSALLIGTIAVEMIYQGAVGLGLGAG